jgi:hypothetical protein
LIASFVSDQALNTLREISSEITKCLQKGVGDVLMGNATVWPNGEIYFTTNELGIPKVEEKSSNQEPEFMLAATKIAPVAY